MAQEKSAKGASLTAAELKEKFAKEQQALRYASAATAVRQMVDVTKNRTKNISTFSKDTLRGYLESINSNQSNLRNLSWYLYYRSQIYMRMVEFYANMFCLDVRSVIPNYSLTKDMNDKKILKSYQETIEELDRMHLQSEFYNIYLTCFVQDVFYGIWVQDDSGAFVWQIPADYGKITGKYTSGDFSISMDMSYFKQRPELLEFIPELNEAYQNYETTRQKWQPVPDQLAVCLKYRYEDYETILPVMAAMFNQIINLSDLEDIQALADESNIYKMLWIELETISGSKDVDDWKVDPALVTEYYNKLVSGLPDYIGAAIVPGKLNEVSFPDSDTSRDVSKVAQSTQAVLNTAGGAEVLNGATVSTSAAFECAKIANTEFAISSLLAQTQAFVNRKLSYRVSNPSKVKFAPISVYTKKQYREDILSDGEHGLPTKLMLGALDGFTPLDILSLNHLEEDILGLSDKLKPLSSSYTQSSSSEGAPTKDADEISDEGDASRDKG